MTQDKNFGQKQKNIIPGGNQLLSKRAGAFLPNLWPAYYKKAKGCSIWDLNNNHFHDFAGNGCYRMYSWVCGQFC